MKVKTSELQGNALDWAVASLENPDLTGATLAFQIRNYNKLMLKSSPDNLTNYSPSTYWAQGGPIIEREMLEISPHFWTTDGWHWVAYVLGPNNQDENYEQRGNTPLIAAMRCYVASKLGDEVELPDELMGS